MYLCICNAVKSSETHRYPEIGTGCGNCLKSPCVQRCKEQGGCPCGGQGKCSDNHDKNQWVTG